MANVVLPAAVAGAQDWHRELTVVIAPVPYSVRLPKEDPPMQAAIFRLYDNQSTPAADDTARWLMDHVAARLNKPAT